jgi:hypothetical protein
MDNMTKETRNEKIDSYDFRFSNTIKLRLVN